VMASLDLAEADGMVTTLAEPNLTALSGETASFLAGGEFPIPIIQGGSAGGSNSVTIVFKEYGVRLNFKPTIIDEDHIRLELEPEVSTLDFTNGVRFDGFVIPALRTRRAKTGVELRDGQSFALAGLLDNNETQSMSKIPGLGDVPILGNLFRSKQFQKNESELMFIVTAQMVQPVNRDDVPRLPNVENMKNGSLLGVEPKSGDLKGPSGFMINSTDGQNGSTTPATQPVVTPKVDGPTAAPATSGSAKAAVPEVSATVPPVAAPSTGEKKPVPNQ
jgi:Flp pilus assembly secretin CpaC